MSVIDALYKHEPCRNCPFRKDSLRGWLGEARASEISGQGSFVCHKEQKKQCAGHMLVLKQNNEFVRLAGKLRIELNISDKRELIFDNVDEFIKHHSRKNYEI